MYHDANTLSWHLDISIAHSGVGKTKILLIRLWIKVKLLVLLEWEEMRQKSSCLVVVLRIFFIILHACYIVVSHAYEIMIILTTTAVLCFSWESVGDSCELRNSNMAVRENATSVWTPLFFCFLIHGRVRERHNPTKFITTLSHPLELLDPTEILMKKSGGYWSG